MYQELTVVQAAYSSTDLFLTNVYNTLQITDHSDFPHLNRFLKELPMIIDKQYNFEQVNTALNSL